MSPDRRKWRLLDTGALSAADNIALDSVLLELCSRQLIGPTLRFLQFSPRAALIGRFQSARQEVREDYCVAEGIDINRRITGGGAIFFDSTQIGWEVIAPFDLLGAGQRLEDVSRLICGAVAEGLGLLGVDAAFRPRNDIEVDGRKISGTGGAHEGGALFFQGTLLVDFDVETMVRTLRVPTEKLSRRELDSARERVTCLAELLDPLPDAGQIKSALAEGISKVLGVKLGNGLLSEAEEELWAERRPYYRSRKWIMDVSEPADEHGILSSIHRGEGGTVRSSVSVDARHRKIKSAMFTGDFFLSPARTVLDLESKLKNAPFDAAPAIIRKHFGRKRWQGLSLSPDDFRLSLAGSLAKAEFPRHGIPLDMANHVSVVGDVPLPDAAARADALLLPYCAKSPDCQFRFTDGCDSCGDCSFGDAWEMAAGAGMTPVTILDYEHLLEVLASLRRGGSSSFIGCCCNAFLVRRYQAFADSGMSTVILNISDTTCYDLGKEKEAYRGSFENKTDLRLELLTAVLALKANGEEDTDLKKNDRGAS